MTLTAEEWKKRLNWVDEDAAVYGEKDWHRDIFALLADLEAAEREIAALKAYVGLVV